MTREPSQEIETVAAEWAARIDRGMLSSEDDARLEAWMAEDSRRRGAFMRMRAIALHSERAQALGPQFDPGTFVELESSGPPSLDRRRALWLGASAIAACAVGAIGMGLTSSGLNFDTRIGEVRVVTLEDGSVVTLNTSTRIRVRYSEGRRLITLDEGEALFDVAHDAARPFIVDAGGTSIRAVGTSFTVKRLAASPVEVLVREGVVEVTRAASSRPVRMVANTRMVATETSASFRPANIAPEEVTREIAWRSGRLAFEGETLAQAADAFARYSDIRIVIDDPAIGREEITGLFAANDPVSFARAAATSLELHAAIGPGEVRLSR